MRHGGYFKYNDKGILIEQKIYKNGNIDGVWSKYSNEGRLTESKVFNNGILIEVIN